MTTAATTPPPHDPYSALRIRNYRDYLVGSFLTTLGRQAITAIAIWQVYQWTHSATALGLVGLVNVLPLLALLPAGALADRYDRKRLIAIGTGIIATLNLALAALSYWHAAVPMLAPLRWANAALRHLALIFERHADPASLHFEHPAVPLIFLLLGVSACVRILVWPARSSITPLLLPTECLGNAITWGSSTFEIATMAGPALGGFLVAYFDFTSVYVLGAVLDVVFVFLLVRLRYYQAPLARATGRRTWRDVFAGAEFIWRKKVILGASTLDMFAVLLGGAVALLPVYADQILQVGPIGFGWLRAAPSIGAFAMAMWIAHRAPLQHPGRALLWSVAGFGVAIVVFGLSKWFWLSLVALFFTGAFDNISVVVRQSLVQLLTPDNLRGRVTAVNQIFIGSSNEIGALRAGLMAALVGPVAAVVWGGLGTIAVTAAVARAVPPLRKLPPLHTLTPEA